MSTVRAEIVRLVGQFDEHADAYRRGDYNETQVRRDFVDPLFAALGWDVHNVQGYAEAYRDVIHEDALRVEKSIKAPDYGFRIGGARKFFVEAKRPSVDVARDATAAFQLRRYAWTAKLPLSILTNFDTLSVYDCRIKPDKNDKASTARILLFRYQEYVERWDEIAGIFSREAILHGAFDRFAESTRKKRGTAEVNEAFLEEIESWRDALARNLSLRNERLTDRELNFAVQRIIDRIVFLRMCEGRGIEPFGQLQTLMNGPDVYRRLVEMFHRADEKYNSGLFHFQHEKDREPPDELTTTLAVDDKVLKDIIVRLYYPESPYEFAALPADILGQVYEQFLGKVIRLTAGHRAKVEEKPEVRKAGGVYYTPTYIVEYIVENTVGKLLEGKTPQAVGGLTANWRPAKTRRPVSVLDPACGSGSFLIVAYQFLLDWYLKQYTEADDPKKHARGANPRVYQYSNGDWRLTTSERKRILLAHIFGVDIDYQAVEVTKLSLLLKVLEGETEETLERQRRLFHKDRALPDLAGNIKCGNSLIGSDFYNGQQMSLLDEEERLRINVFDWDGRDGFPGIMRAGGFDAVIGNPPYVLLQDEFRNDTQLTYFRSRYACASYKLDTYHLFMERAIHLAKRDGLASMITPANFLTNNHLDLLRRFLLTETNIDHVWVVEKGVFRGISVDSAVWVVQCGGPPKATFHIVHACPGETGLDEIRRQELARASILEDPYVLFTGGRTTDRPSLWQRCLEGSLPLGKLAHVNFGKQLRNRQLYDKDVVTVKSIERVGRRYRPCYTGRDVHRYALRWGHLACLNDRIAQCGGCWHEDKQNARNKLLTRQIGRFPTFALDELGYQCLNTVFMINVKEDGIDPLYLLGIVNSRLMAALWLERFYDRRRTFPKIKGTYLKHLPVRTGEADSDVQDRMVALVRQILDLNARLPKVRTAYDRTALQRQIDATDRQIDRLVYDLYGLSDEEIRLVEEATVE